MDIVIEQESETFGEHDFFFMSKDLAESASDVLTRNGFAVKENRNPYAVTLVTGALYKTCVKQARAVLEAA